MAITNGYCTLAQLKSEMTIPDVDSTDDTKLELSIAAASRQIDAFCGRRFWVDGSVVAREFAADDSGCVYVDDISTTTGLIVKTDTDGDGTFENTLTITTDFRLWPFNAADMVPVRPYERILVPSAGNYYFPMLANGLPGVQVTAKFGWPAVPDDVTKACLVQASQLFKSSAAVFGVVQFADAGVALRTGSQLNPIAAALLETYRKPPVG